MVFIIPKNELIFPLTGVIAGFFWQLNSWIKNKKQLLKKREVKNKSLVALKVELTQKNHAQMLFSFLLNYVEKYEIKYMEALHTTMFKLEKNELSHSELIDFIKMNKSILDKIEGLIGLQNKEELILKFMNKNDIALTRDERYKNLEKEKYMELL